MLFLNLQKKYKNLIASLYTVFLKTCTGKIGKNSKIFPPFHSNNMSKVYIGENVCVLSNGWIDVIESYGSITYKPRIEIGSNTYIGHNAHIISCQSIKIGSQVVIADKVYITDNLHGYEDVNKSVLETDLVSPGPVVIEDQVWLGENVCVLPNVTIGRHSVIGSNSVVTKSIPPYSVAVGSPAVVIKKYDQNSKTWVRVVK